MEIDVQVPEADGSVDALTDPELPIKADGSSSVLSCDHNPTVSVCVGDPTL